MCKIVIHENSEIKVYLLKDSVVNYFDAAVSCGEPEFQYNVPREEVSAVDLLDAGGGDSYVVDVFGDSMTEAGINPGDKVVINTQRQAESGDIVLAYKDGGCLLKVFHHDDVGNFWLVPANKKYAPMPFGKDEGDRILGVMVCKVSMVSRFNARVVNMLNKRCNEQLQVIRMQMDPPSWALTNRAKALFAVPIEEGLLDDNLQPCDGVPVWKLGGLADKIGDELGLRYKWSDFGEMWQINKDNLRSNWTNALNLPKEKEFSKKILSKIR